MYIPLKVQKLSILEELHLVPDCNLGYKPRLRPMYIVENEVTNQIQRRGVGL